MVCDGEDGVEALRFQELRDKVQCNCLEWECFWYGVDGAQGRSSGSIVDLVLLAFCTSPDIIRDFFLECWPPIVPFQQLYRSIDSQVSVHWWVMMRLDK